MPAILEAQVGATCSWVEVNIPNAARGDLLLSTASGGVIKELMGAIGQTRTHSGMIMTDGSQYIVQVRHNTMYADKIYTTGGGEIPTAYKSIGSHSLRDGYPGVIQSNIGAAANSFNFGNSILVQGPSRLASTRNASATEIYKMVGWYRLFAYTNIAWSDYYDVDYNEGNMCSGTIYWSYKGRKQDDWFPMDYSASTRNTAAKTLHDAVYNKIMKKDSGFGLEDVFELFEQDSISTFAKNASNQVVNCMAFNDCGNTSSSRWQAGVGTGSSLSPDDITLLASLYLYVYGNGTANNFPYQWAVTPQFTGGYYDCPF